MSPPAAQTIVWTEEPAAVTVEADGVANDTNWPAAKLTPAAALTYMKEFPPPAEAGPTRSHSAPRSISGVAELKYLLSYHGQSFALASPAGEMCSV